MIMTPNVRSIDEGRSSGRYQCPADDDISEVQVHVPSSSSSTSSLSFLGKTFNVVV